MTISKAERQRPPERPNDCWSYFVQQFNLVYDRKNASNDPFHWPNTKWHDKPIEFAREVLGITLTHTQQTIANAVRDHKRVACASGHRIGKSTIAAVLALWYYCCYHDSRVVLTSTTNKQVDGILWREVRRLRAMAHHEIDGEIGQLARTGLKSGFREIWGFTADEAEGFQGFAGAHLLFILDEASGIDQGIFEALSGNRAGGATVLLLGNPTRTDGEFFDAFFSKQDFYKCFRVSSLESPNVIAEEEIVPGLATKEWVEEMAREYGVESPLYKIRVLGEHVLNESGRVISVHEIQQSEERWDQSEEHGPLYLGVDPAGPGGLGDESCIVARRGNRVLALVAQRGWSEEVHVVQTLGMIASYRVGTEDVVINVDREGPIGKPLCDALKYAVSRLPGDVSVVGIRASNKAARQPDVYDRMRDELWASLQSWMHRGGAILTDPKLEAELHAPSWEVHVNGKLKATPKTELYKALKRSTDRADALALAVWERSLIDEREDARTTSQDVDEDMPKPVDMFDASKCFR